MHAQQLRLQSLHWAWLLSMHPCASAGMGGTGSGDRAHVVRRAKA
jgi:hypothetical protein